MKQRKATRAVHQPVVLERRQPVSAWHPIVGRIQRYQSPLWAYSHAILPQLLMKKALNQRTLVQLASVCNAMATLTL